MADMITRAMVSGLVFLAGGVVVAPRAAEPTLVVATPESPPAWALLERELLRVNSEACERFAEKYLDERGYLLHTPRWGTLDGPDDAIETFNNWTLLHALGGSDSVVRLYKKALEGHLRQYGELRTTLTELARNGAYYKEFITQSDWFHTGEGMRGFFLMGLSEPNDERYRERMKRFAGLYMNEDPEAPNYDPVHKVIKSIWTGSRGPMLRPATVYDWVGDPVAGSFHLLHNRAGRSKLLDMAAWGAPVRGGGRRGKEHDNRWTARNRAARAGLRRPDRVPNEPVSQPADARAVVGQGLVSEKLRDCEKIDVT